MTRATKPAVKAKAPSKEKSGAKPRRAAVKSARHRYLLRLYITGQTPRSMRSVENLRALCDKYLQDNFELEVVDIYQQPAMAAAGQIIAAPTLVKSMPLPLRRLVGDFSDRDRVILGLDLKVDRE